MTKMQNMVDNFENCGKISSQLNDSEEFKMHSENLSKTDTLKVMCQESGVVVIDLDILLKGKNLDVWNQTKVKSKQSEINEYKEIIEKASEKLLISLGVDTTIVKKYVFGKHVAFALSYGASKQKAIEIGLGALNKNIFSGIASNTEKVRSFINNPKILDSYDEIVGNLFIGHFDIAQKLAMDLWKKSLAKGIVVSVDELEAALEIDKLDVKNHSTIIPLIRKAKGFAESILIK